MRHIAVSYVGGPTIRERTEIARILRLLFGEHRPTASHKGFALLSFSICLIAGVGGATTVWRTMSVRQIVLAIVGVDDVPDTYTPLHGPLEIGVAVLLLGAAVGFLVLLLTACAITCYEAANSYLFVSDDVVARVSPLSQIYSLPLLGLSKSSGWSVPTNQVAALRFGRQFGVVTIHVQGTDGLPHCFVLPRSALNQLGNGAAA